MRLLLDTHAFLWFVAGDPRLSRPARRRIEASSNEKLLSVASIWEIAIKASLGKISLALSLDELVEEGAIKNGFGVLEVRRQHAAGVLGLPFHHRDPFDRLLVAQAICEGLVLLSGDEVLDRYSIERVW